MRIAIYLRGNYLYINAAKLTTAGVYLDDEPRLIVPYTERCEEIGKLMHDALQASKEVVPHPKSFDPKPNVFYEHSKTKGWKSFVKGTRCFAMEIDNNVCAITDYGYPDSRGGYTPRKNITIDADTSDVTTCALLACEKIKRILELGD